MKRLKNMAILYLAWCLMLTRTAWATEKLKKASIVSDSEVYLKAFYAAFATLLVILVIWLLIFRPSFKGSDDKF